VDLAEGKNSAVTGRNLAQGLVRLEVPLLALVYVNFVLSDGVPLAAFGLIGVIWVARVWTTGRLSLSTPLDLPIWILLAWLPISLVVTAYPWLSLPKVYGVVLGAAFFYAVVNQVATRRDLAWAAFWLVVTCTAISIAGLIGTDWAQSKIVSAAFIYERLPRVIQGIPRSIAGGFARNGVGGTLTMIVPLLACLAFARDWTPLHGQAMTQTKPIAPDRAITPNEAATPDHSYTRWIPFIVWFALILSVVTLALTQSRGGILGTAVGLLGVAIWRDKRFAWLIIIGAVGLAVVVLAGQAGTLVEFVLRMDAQSSTLASRMEVWQRGIMMVQDFPLTGIGIGTYNNLAHTLYPFFIASPDEVVAHAHNNLLEVAVDVGIPGLVAYVAVLTGFIVCAVTAYRTIGDTFVCSLIAGLCFGMLAHQVFGLTDAFILGTKPGLIMWVYCALAVIVYVQRDGLRNKSGMRKN
jgi:putative inorganic carbon (hco3(-)) transporter